MVVRREVFVAFIIFLFLAAIVDAQPYSDSFGASTILERPIPNPKSNHCHPLDAFIAGGDDRTPPLKLFTAQTSQPADPQIQQTQETMPGIRERLEARIQALEAEWAAIKKEEEEINRIGGGGTLRGSKAKKFMKRTDEFNQRVMKYNTEKEKLRQDIEDYEAIVKAKETAVQENIQESVQPQAAPE